jgi:hypothetical protein
MKMILPKIFCTGAGCTFAMGHALNFPVIAAVAHCAQNKGGRSMNKSHSLFLVFGWEPALQ